MKIPAIDRWCAKACVVESGCWEWQGAIAKTTGYGIFTVRTHVQVLAHRFAWELAYGAIPRGTCACHRCFNRHCVNPAHLFLGTTADHIRYSMREGRRKRGARPKWGPDHPQRLDPSLVLRGERHGMAKLTEDAVRAIRAADVTAPRAVRQLSRRYGISDISVQRVLDRETWRHV